MIVNTLMIPNSKIGIYRRNCTPMTTHDRRLRFVCNCPSYMSNPMPEPRMTWNYFVLKMRKFKETCHLFCQSASKSQTLVFTERTGELSRHAFSVQTADYPNYEFSFPTDQEVQLVRIGKKIYSILIITNDCNAPNYKGRSIRGDSLYYNGLALTDLLSIWIISNNT